MPQLSLAAPGCPDVTYTIYVLDSAEPEALLLGSRSVPGDGSKAFSLSEMDVIARNGDLRVCVYATSSDGNQIIDRMPVQGCAVSDAISDIRTTWWFA